MAAAITLEQIWRKLEKVEKQQAIIINLTSAQKDKPKWVRLAEVMRVTGFTKEQVRFRREQDPSIAHEKTNGRYEYNLNAFKELA